MERADFYVGMGLDAEWLGSVSRCGEIWAISTPILLQVNQTMYEESVIEYIKYCEGVVANHVCQWPWIWNDSRMTAFSYMFLPEYNKVFMSIMGEELLDPIKIMQGESIIESDVKLGAPDFPLMIDQIRLEDIEAEYGYKPTTLI